MSGRIRLAPREHPAIRNGKYNAALRQPRLGVMLHYDDSSSDQGAMGWFRDPRCEVSYHFLVLDDGSYVEIAPRTARAWHAGVCSPSAEIARRGGYSDANSAFYGIAAATNGQEGATPLQLLTIAYLTRTLFRAEGWDPAEGWRVTGHSAEAAPRGRKVDPEGASPKHPILSVAGVRSLLPRIELDA